MLVFSRNVRNVFLGIVGELCETASLLPVTMVTHLLFQDLKDVTLSETDRYIILYLSLRPSNFYAIYFQYSNCHHTKFCKINSQLSGVRSKINTELCSRNWTHWRLRDYRKRNNGSVWYVQVLPTC